jgi:AraC family transcriptional regulator
MNAEKSTLGKYIIEYRIDKVKELFVHTDKTLADIAFALGFSSVAHLSKQFKDNTGLNPSHFRQIKLDNDAAQPIDGSLK